MDIFAGWLFFGVLVVVDIALYVLIDELFENVNTTC